MKIGLTERALWTLFLPTFQKNAFLIGVNEPVISVKLLLW